jgi:CheY-like chemotaxis protein
VETLAPEPQPPSDHDGRIASQVTFRILIADDNKDAAQSTGMMLRMLGNEVRTVHNGLQAVEEAEAFRPDVILLDIGMPQLNGYEAAQRIRQQRWGKDMVLVALTGWGQEDDKERATAAGFDQHFTKPVNPTDLERLLANLQAYSSPRDNL